VIYQNPNSDDPVDQGDLIDGCPVTTVTTYDLANPASAEVTTIPARVVVLTQTCDLANDKVPAANVAVVFEAQFLVDEHVLKPAEIKGPLRSGRIWDWYFLPADAALGLGEMVVDLRRLHTVKLDLLRTLCRAGKRRGRVGPLYREHLAKHFADTFSRIGLPRPYETL
jgi:hypothetical protein